MTLPEFSYAAQLVIATFTMVGVLASLYFSTKALREVQADRQQRQRHYLAFERGGHRYPIKFVNAGRRIPGVDPKAVERLFPSLPDGSESVRLDEKKKENGSIDLITIGHLKNYGLGPALSVRVTWIPIEVWIRNERFEINEQKLAEPIYSVGLNTMPSVPAHILPGEEAGLSRLPTFIEKDVEKKITRVEGILAIAAQDVFGNPILSRQEFSIFTGYKDEKPWFHVSIGDLILNDAAA